MNFPSTGKAIRSALYPLPFLVGQAAAILVKYDFLLLPSRMEAARQTAQFLVRRTSQAATQDLRPETFGRFDLSAC